MIHLVAGQLLLVHLAQIRSLVKVFAFFSLTLVHHGHLRLRKQQCIGMNGMTASHMMTVRILPHFAMKIGVHRAMTVIIATTEWMEPVVRAVVDTLCMRIGAVFPMNIHLPRPPMINIPSCLL